MEFDFFCPVCGKGLTWANLILFDKDDQYLGCEYCIEEVYDCGYEDWLNNLHRRSAGRSNDEYEDDCFRQ